MKLLFARSFPASSFVSRAQLRSRGTAVHFARWPRTELFQVRLFYFINLQRDGVSGTLLESTCPQWQANEVFVSLPLRNSLMQRGMGGIGRFALL